MLTDDGGAQLFCDAGVTAIAAVRYPAYPFGPHAGACASTIGGIRCTDNTPSSDRTESRAGLAMAAPAFVAAPPMSTLTLGAFHACGLTGDGHVMCWGDNFLGQLGDRSAQPLGLQRMPARA